MEKAAGAPARKPASKHSKWTLFKKQWRIQAVLIPMAIWAFAIFYAPALGNVIAFENYRISPGFIGFFKSQFVGLKQFKEFLTNTMTLELFRNTLAMSVMALVFGTLAAIVFALLLNEVRNMTFKRVTQTISYLPYFISMAICANLFIQLLDPTGPINSVLVSREYSNSPSRSCSSRAFLVDHHGAEHLEEHGLERDHLHRGHRGDRPGNLRGGLGGRRGTASSACWLHHDPQPPTHYGDIADTEFRRTSSWAASSSSC